MTSTSDPSAAPRWRPLDGPQRRVLGVLIEKAKTTPAGYPMSVNAIVTGCNQKNNRDPLTSYEEFDVEKALSELQEIGVVKEIDWVGRVPKYKHEAYTWLGVRPVELAVLAELLLRGPQAMGDLRARAARMEAIEDLDALKPIVESLVQRKLMIELTPAGRGQLVTHGLYLPEELATVRAQAGRSGASEAPKAPAPPAPLAPRPDPVERLAETKLLTLAGLATNGGASATFRGGEHGANVSFFVLRMAHGEALRRHRHAYEETFILLEGEISLDTAGTVRTLGAGTVAVIPARTWHSFRVTSGTPIHMVTLHPVPRIAAEWAD